MSTNASHKPATPGSDKSAKPASGRLRLVRPLLLALAIGILSYLFHVYLDRVWSERMDPHIRDVVHIVGHVASALAAVVIVAWMIMRKTPVFLLELSMEADPSQRSLLSETDQRKVYAKWFIGMRWIAVLVAGFLVFVGVRVFAWLSAEVWWPLAITIAALAGSNLLYGMCLRRGWHESLLLQAQAYIDLFFLVVLLHFSGGIENIFSMFMIFHVIIGGVLLSRRHCYGIAAAASVLFAAMALGEWGDLIEHYKLELLPHVKGQVAHSTLYVLCWIVLLTVVLFLTAYFVTTLTERIRADENRRERHRQQYRRQVIAATEEERKRLARELHDHTGQALTSLIAQLTVMEIGAENAARGNALAELRRQVEQDLSDVRELSHVLRPSSLDDVGLLAALEKHCQVCSERLGIAVECDAVGVAGGRRLPGQVEVAVYRIAQEGITNAARHGRAHSVSVLLQRRGSELLVVVEDDGVGFDARDWREQCVRGDHLGLLGIEERAVLLGGALRVESRPGSGTSLFVNIPLEDSDHV